MTARRTNVPLVFLNAFPLDSEQWEPLLAVLDAPVGDIITFDPPGIGEMPATPEDPSLDLIADAAVAAMREVTGSPDALWVGCSMGGYVAMAVLERHPDAVAGIGLLATRAVADTEAAKARRLEAATAAMAHDGLVETPRAPRARSWVPSAARETHLWTPLPPMWRVSGARASPGANWQWRRARLGSRCCAARTCQLSSRGATKTA